MQLPRFRLVTLMVALAVLLADIGGSMNRAAAQGRRGGWSKDPFWWRVEFCGLATVLALCVAGFAWNCILRRREQEAHDLADRVAEPDHVDGFLKDL